MNTSFGSEGRQRQLCFIQFVDKCLNVQVKLCDALVSAISEHFWGDSLSRRHYVKCTNYLHLGLGWFNLLIAGSVTVLVSFELLEFWR